MKTKAGKIVISEELILTWLDYVGGRIRYVGLNEIPGTVEIVIEHEDMPELNEGDNVPEVAPLYIRHQDAVGHFVIMRQRNEDKQD
jgi:hypothetical protein